MKFSFTFVLIILAVIMFKPPQAAASSCTSTGGAWSESTTWSCGSVPASSNCFDTLVINANTLVDEQLDFRSCPRMVVIVNARLEFQQGNKLRMACGSQVWLNGGGWLIPLGGGGNSNLLEICGDIYWRTADGPLQGPLFLDIELESFTAQVQEKQVQLHWVTKSETNNNFFTIERSQDGEHFEAIGQLSGAGTSNESRAYQFTDSKPMLGYSYYRLKQTDFDGTFTYTEQQSAYLKPAYVVEFFPNPVVEQLNIEVHSPEMMEVEIGIWTIDGRNTYLNHQTLHNGIHQLSIDAAELKTGHYILRVRTPKGDYIQKTFFKN